MADITVGTLVPYSDTTLTKRQAGEAIGANKLYYLSAGKIWIATSNEVAKAVVLGMTTFAVATDGYTFGWEGGAIGLGATLTVNNPIRLSTAGGLTHDAVVSGKYHTVIGYPDTAAKVTWDLFVSGIANP